MHLWSLTEAAAHSLFYVDEEGDSSAEIDWPDVAALVEAGVIGDETLV